MSTDYREKVAGLTRPATQEEKDVEMVAMFLCDSGIIPLGPSEDGSRRSGGHGWHRTHEEEREAYRVQARIALRVLDRTAIPTPDLWKDD